MAHLSFPHSPGLATITDRLSSGSIGSLLSNPSVAAAGAAAAGSISGAAPVSAELNVPDLLSCILPLTAEVSFGSMSAEISNLKSVHNSCLLAFVQLAAMSPSVVRLGISSRPQLTNYEARGVTQVI